MVTLGELVHIKHGFAFKGRYFTAQPQPDAVITPGNFAIGGGFQQGKIKYYAGPIPEDFILSPGDVVVTMTDLSKASDTLGFAAVIPAHLPYRLLHNQRIGLVQVKRPEDASGTFLHWVMRTPPYRQEVLASASGSTVRHTSPKRISAFRFRLPPLPEQRRIAAVLGALDDKIELNRKMNRTLEEMAQALFKSWFIDFDGHEDLVDSELGPIPRGWEVSSIAKDFRLTMGLSPPGSSYNQDGVGMAFFQGARDFGDRFPTRRVYTTDARRFAEPGDTLVSVRAPVGRPNIATEKCCIGRGVASLRHNSGSRSYTFAVAKHLEQRFSVFNGEGTVFGSINKRDFLSLPVFGPPAQLIEKFDALVRPLDDRVRVNHDESRTLATLRDTLLPKLISGELRVPEAEDLVSALPSPDPLPDAPLLAADHTF